MGRRGPKPKATQFRLLKGAIRPDRFNAEEPKAPSVDVLDVPDLLDGYGQRWWTELTSELKALNMLATVDRKWLMLTCETASKWERYNEKLRQFGEVLQAPPTIVVDKDGKEHAVASKKFQTSPYALLERHAQAHLIKLLDGLGMNPSARSRVKGGGQQSRLESFIAKQKKRA